MLKNKILSELENNRGRAISGQVLADKYSVSRNAVWKAINSLKNEGFDIVSASNKGYMIADSCDIISEEGIRSFLSSTDRDIDIKVFDKIDSTNNEAKRIMASGVVKNTLIVADSQIKGRGRLGRDFYSPEKSGIYMTLIYNIGKDVSTPILITMATAVAVVRAIEKMTNIKPKIKWVNDIFVGGKKAGGILTEAQTDLETGRIESVAIGIGLNFKEDLFPEELKDIAVSLAVNDVKRNEMIAQIVHNIMTLCEKLDTSLFMPDYISRQILIGKKVQYEKNDIKHTGIVSGINQKGELQVKVEGEVLDNICSGEVYVVE